MSTHEITLDADAYERLTSARQSGESFSAVIKRLTPDHSRPAQSTQKSSPATDEESTPPGNCSGASNLRGRVYIDRYGDI
jgi:predicted CopG family antitoxin